MNCIYVSSFARRPGSFGDYSEAFEGVLCKVYERVVRCDVEPLLDIKGLGVLRSANKLAESYRDRVDHLDVIHFEAVQYHSVAWLMVKALKKIFPGAKIHATVHDCPNPFQKVILSYCPLRILTYWKFARIIDKSPIGKKLYRSVVKQIDTTFLLSDSGVNDYIKKWGVNEQVFSIKHVLLSDNDAQMPSRELKKKFTVYYTGSWWTHKGIETLLDAIQLLKNHFNTAAKLILSGRCDQAWYQEKIEAQLEEVSKYQEVEYVGYQSFDEIRHTAQSSHIWVIPYNDAPKVACSGIMNLAMSYGACIVCSDLPQFSELIENDRTGKIFKRQDPMSLSSVFSELAQEPDLVYKLRESMWVTVRKELSSQSIAEDMMYKCQMMKSNDRI